MPVTMPVSEMQRNAAALTEEAMRTKQPIYLTKRGKSAVVLLDAQEYDRQMAYRNAILAREEAVLAGISQGHEEIAQGKSVKLEDALAQLDAKWGQLMEKGDEDDLKEYEVELAESVLLALLAIASKEDALKVRRRLQMLKVAPAMGAFYNPIYDSAMPDHEVRATFTGHYGIYYTVDEANSKVAIEYLEDCRRNPLKKFSQ